MQEISLFACSQKISTLNIPEGDDFVNNFFDLHVYHFRFKCAGVCIIVCNVQVYVSDCAQVSE